MKTKKETYTKTADNFVFLPLGYNLVAQEVIFHIIRKGEMVTP